MTEQASGTGSPTDTVGRALYQICFVLAVFGGLLCCVMAALVTVSVTGRYLLAAPVPGDYDLVGIISGNAVFAFLPYCQLIRGNVVVDFFTTNAPARAKAALDAVGSLLFLLIAVIFTWRMYYGMLEMRAYQEVIAAFNFYRWSTIPFNLLCMLTLIVVIAYTLVRNIDEIRTGRGTVQAGVKWD